MMADRLKARQPVIDAFIASPARRAKKTAQLFVRAFGKAEEDVIYISALYHAPSYVFFEEIEKLPDTTESVAIFSHNPGITHFVNELVSGVRVDNMPTCAIFAISAETSAWSGFEKAKKEFLFFEYPKKS